MTDLSPYAVAALVLLPAMMYGLALMLNLARGWFGRSRPPRARSVIAARGVAVRAAPVTRQVQSGEC